MADTKLKFTPNATPTAGGLKVWLGDINGSNCVTLLTTSSLSANQSLLNTLFGSGNTTLTGDWTAGIVIEFKGIYANSNIPPLSFDASALTFTPIASYTQSYGPYVAPIYATVSLNFGVGSNPINGGSYTIDGQVDAYTAPPATGPTWTSADASTPTDGGSVNLIAVVAESPTPLPSFDVAALTMDDPSNPGNSIPWDGIAALASFMDGDPGAQQIDLLSYIATGGTLDVLNIATPISEPFNVGLSTLQADLRGSGGDFSTITVSNSGYYPPTVSANFYLIFPVAFGASTAGGVDGSALTGLVTVTPSVLQAGSSSGSGGSIFASSIIRGAA